MSVSFNSYFKYIGPRIYDLRDRADLTQQELARSTGVAQQAISKFERCKHFDIPALDAAEKIARFFRVDFFEEFFASTRSTGIHEVKGDDWREIAALITAYQSAGWEARRKAIRVLTANQIH